jgi:hypothetical protein
MNIAKNINKDNILSFSGFLYRTFISIGNFKKRNHIEIEQNIHLSIFSIFQKSFVVTK